jgi:hypothetical protein
MKRKQEADPGEAPWSNSPPEWLKLEQFEIVRI